jgi:hypothetical protein
MGKKVETIFASLILIFSVFFLIRTYEVNPRFKDLEGFMSAYFAPRVFLIFLILLTSFLILKAALSKKRLPFAIPQPKYLLFTIFSCVGYSILIYPLGYFATTWIFLALMAKIMGQFKWKSVIVVSLIFAFVSHIFFIRFFQVDLPCGIFSFK